MYVRRMNSRILAFVLAAALCFSLISSWQVSAAYTIVSDFGKYNLYNGIFFNTFHSPGGDIEGALAVRNKATLGSKEGQFDVGGAAAGHALGKYPTEDFPGFLTAGMPDIGVNSRTSGVHVYGGDAVMPESIKANYNALSQNKRFNWYSGTKRDIFVSDSLIQNFFDRAYAYFKHAVDQFSEANTATIKLTDFTTWEGRSKVKNTFADPSRFEAVLEDAAGRPVASKVLVIHVDSGSSALINEPYYSTTFDNYDLVVFNFPKAVDVSFQAATYVYNAGTGGSNLIDTQTYWNPNNAESVRLAKYASKIIWSFPKASTVKNLYGAAVIGSIIAPDAKVLFTGGQINGMAVAKDCELLNTCELHSFYPPDIDFGETGFAGEGNLVLLKYDNDSNTPGQSDTPTLLDGAKFQIYRKDEDGKLHYLVNPTPIRDEEETVFITEGGRIIWNALPVGTYYIEEIEPPTGHKIMGDHIKKVEIKPGSSPNDIIYVEFYNEIMFTDITFKKTGQKAATGTDADRYDPLAGVTFELYRILGDPLSRAMPILHERITTQSDGLVKFTKLEASYYSLVEVAGPAGYKFMEDSFNFHLAFDTSGNPTILFLGYGDDWSLSNDITHRLISATYELKNDRLATGQRNLTVYKHLYGDSLDPDHYIPVAGTEFTLYKLVSPASPTDAVDSYFKAAIRETSNDANPHNEAWHALRELDNNNFFGWNEIQTLPTDPTGHTRFVVDPDCYYKLVETKPAPGFDNDPIANTEYFYVEPPFTRSPFVIQPATLPVSLPIAAEAEAQEAEQEEYRDDRGADNAAERPDDSLRSPEWPEDSASPAAPDNTDTDASPDPSGDEGGTDGAQDVGTDTPATGDGSGQSDPTLPTGGEGDEETSPSGGSDPSDPTLPDSGETSAPSSEPSDASEPTTPSAPESGDGDSGDDMVGDPPQAPDDSFPAAGGRSGVGNAAYLAEGEPSPFYASLTRNDPVQLLPTGNTATPTDAADDNGSPRDADPLPPHSPPAGISILRGGADSFSFTFQNAALGEIIVYKRDADTDELKDGAVFELYYKDGNNWEPIRQKTTGEDSSVGTGACRFWNLPPGEYRVAEITPPEDYELDPEQRVSWSAQYKLDKNNNKQNISNPGSDQNFIAKIIGKEGDLDKHVFEFTARNPKEVKGELRLHKIDGNSNQSLPNASFVLKVWNEEAGGWDSHSGPHRTDAGGNISISGLPAGIYKITEITPPAGYVLEDQYNQNELIFTISRSTIGDTGVYQGGTIEVKNYPAGTTTPPPPGGGSSSSGDGPGPGPDKDRTTSTEPTIPVNDPPPASEPPEDSSSKTYNPNPPMGILPIPFIGRALIASGSMLGAATLLWKSGRRKD